MKPTRELVKNKFNEFNRLMFAGRLEAIPIEITDAASYMGQCVSKCRQLSDGRREHSDFRLKISNRVSLPESELEDIIIHEMIHYFITSSGLQDTSTHGEIFKAIMRSINSAYGRHISISHRLTEQQRDESAKAKRSWHVIAAVIMKSGKRGVKVLPRVIPKILHYYRQVSATPDVERVELYLHDNPFFNRYPNSAALRIYHIERNELTDNLNGAHKLIVKGDKLIQQ